MLPEILDWSSSLNFWQRDALRRIVMQPTIEHDDIEQLALLCKKPHGLSDTESEPIPLQREHVPGDGAHASVSLKSVKHVSDVNALAVGQSLVLGAIGLTVVYGDNGSGKSGYSRILKRACRARGSGDPVLPNALSQAPAGTPCAEIVALVDGVEVTHTWRDGTASVAELAAVSVFDSAAAQVYVSNKTEVAFRPRGLDVLDRLADVVKRVRVRIEKELAEVHRVKPVLPAITSNTAAGRQLGALNALTSKAIVEALANVTAVEHAELERLRTVIVEAKAHDPAKRANELRTKAARVRSLAKHLANVTKYVDDRAAARQVQLRTNVKDALAAADVALQVRAGNPVPGVGGTLWRALWDAARQYGEGEVHKGQSFPQLGEDSRCVLCQQSFDDEAQKRMQEFHNIVVDKTQQAARETKEVLEKARAELTNLQPVGSFASVIDEVAAEEDGLGIAIRTFVDACDAARRLFLECIDGTGTPAGIAVSLPAQEMEALATAFQTKATEITDAADPAVRAKVETAVRELEARLQLAAGKDVVVGEIDRLARINAYEACLKDAVTNSITRKSTELTKTYVTDALAASFELELKRLGFDHPELVLRAVGGQSGALLHQIQLKHATRAELFRIVSEGEARSLALAAFLSELSTAAHTSGIIFDDPVSSLDHRWRGRVARRLVEEAKQRQVVVFTHELAFLFELTRQAQRLEVECATRALRRSRDHAGHVEDELPWKGLTTKKRVGWLRNEFQAVEKLHRIGDVDYDRRATGIYAKLRQAWEHAVEEELLNEVVMRFRDSVQTQSLRPISEDHIKAVHRGMTKASKWEGGHDQASALNEPVPSPEELKGDIDVFAGWLDSLNQRPKPA